MQTLVRGDDKMGEFLVGYQIFVYWKMQQRLMVSKVHSFQKHCYCSTMPSLCSIINTMLRT